MYTLRCAVTNTTLISFPAIGLHSAKGYAQAWIMGHMKDLIPDAQEAFGSWEPDSYPLALKLTGRAGGVVHIRRYLLSDDSLSTGDGVCL